MAISKLIFNGVVQMDVTGDTVDSTNLLSGFQATGADGETVYGSYTPAAAGYAVTIDNHATDETCTATISGIVNGNNYSGLVYFTVSCVEPCVVAYTINGGTSYTRLAATATGITNTYLFSVNVSQAMTIAVAIKGDANDDGILSNKDATRISSYVAGNPGVIIPFLPAADVDNDGDIDADDQTLVMQQYRSRDAYDWLGLL